MRDSWDYIEARLAEQRSTAEHRRRVAAARSRNGTTNRFASLFRTRSCRSDEFGGRRE